MHAPLNQEIVNDTAKLIMHRLIARLLVRDPLLIDRAKVSLTKISAHFPDRSFVVGWEKLLRLPTSELRALLTSRNQDMKRLRLSSPFVTAEGVDFSDQAAADLAGCETNCSARLTPRHHVQPRH